MIQKEMRNGTCMSSMASNALQSDQCASNQIPNSVLKIMYIGNKVNIIEHNF